jgi:GGDEF domain-containing protein
MTRTGTLVSDEADAPQSRTSAGRLRLAAIATGSAVVVAIPTLDITGALSHNTLVKVNDAAQLIAGLLAAVLCWWTSRTTGATAGIWRRRMAWAMGGWTAGMSIWAWYQVVEHRPLPSPTLADVGFFALPVFALGALLAIWSAGSEADSLRRASIVLVLDGAVLVGSLLTLTWMTALGDVFREGDPSGLEGAVAVAYPVTDLLLVTIVGLVVLSERVPSAYRLQVTWLALGLVALSLSDSVFAYLVANGADEMEPRYDTGFIAGPLLIALAATTARHGGRGVVRTGRARISYVTLLLPVIVAITLVAVVVQFHVGGRIDTFEKVSAGFVAGLVVLRMVVATVAKEAINTGIQDRQIHDSIVFSAGRTTLLQCLDEARHARATAGTPYTLAVIDIADVVMIDDEFGGRVVPQLRQRMQSSLPGDGTAVRVGPARFAVLIEGAAEDPRSAVERVVKSVRYPLPVGQHTVSLDATAGVVEGDPDDLSTSTEVVLQRALLALEAADEQGPGAVVLYQPDDLSEPTASSDNEDAAHADPLTAELARLAEVRRQVPDRLAGYISGFAQAFNPAGALRRRRSSSADSLLTDLDALIDVALVAHRSGEPAQGQTRAERHRRQPPLDKGH